MAAAAGVINFARTWLLEKLPEHFHQIMAVDVVTNLFTFVTKHAIRRPGDGATHQICEKTMQLRTGMRRTSEATTAKTSRLHAKIFAVLLHQHVSGNLGRAKQRMLRLVNAHGLGNSRFILVAGFNFPTLFQFDQRQPVRRVAINLVSRCENKNSFGTKFPRGLQQVQGTNRIYAEIRVRIARRPVMRWLRGGVNDKSDLLAEPFKQTFNRGAVADVKVVMLVVGNTVDKLLPVGKGGRLFAEKPLAQIIVNADHFKTFLGKTLDAFGTNQTGGTSDDNNAHIYFADTSTGAGVRRKLILWPRSMELLANIHSDRYTHPSKMKNVFVTGAAGFIGSNLAERLLADGKAVVGWDNFSTGQKRFLAHALSNPNYKLVEGDNLDLTTLTKAMAGCDTVFHLAANADVRFGLEHPSKDLQQNTVATFNVLEAMRANGIKRIAFSSTGSVYGEAEKIPTPEDAPFPIQTSLYAASKVSGEGMISSYCEGFGFEGYVFRFVSILGERYTHGHVFDFYKQLLDHPSYLKILGDGTQRKSYLYVQDCVNAMRHVMDLGMAKKAKHGVEVYNLGTNEYVQVNDSVRFICAELGLDPRLEYTGGKKGWIGDNPFIFLDTQKVQSTGWKTELTIKQGIGRTLEWLKQNQWVFESRQ